MSDLSTTPRPVPSYDAMGTTTDKVNYRTVPTTTGNTPVGYLPLGTQVHIINKITTNETPSDWYQIDLQGRSYWVAARYVQINRAPVGGSQSGTAPADSSQGIVLDVPWVTQIVGVSGHNACGEASVTMLLKYYQKDPGATLEDMAASIGKVGKYTSDADLISLAWNYGKISLARLNPCASVDALYRPLVKRNPVILFVNYFDLHFDPTHLGGGADQGLHWLVVTGYQGDAFILNDPLWLQTQRDGKGGAGLSITASDLEHAVRPGLSSFLALY